MIVCGGLMMKNLMAATLAGGAILAAAAPAHASPGGYLQELNDRGLVITDVTAALAVGYQVCHWIDTIPGYTGYEAAMELSEYPELDRWQAAEVVVAAVGNLCPQFEPGGAENP